MGVDAAFRGTAVPQPAIHAGMGAFEDRVRVISRIRFSCYFSAPRCRLILKALVLERCYPHRKEDTSRHADMLGVEEVYATSGRDRNVLEEDGQQLGSWTSDELGPSREFRNSLEREPQRRRTRTRVVRDVRRSPKPRSLARKSSQRMASPSLKQAR